MGLYELGSGMYGERLVYVPAHRLLRQYHVSASRPCPRSRHAIHGRISAHEGSERQKKVRLLEDGQDESVPWRGAQMSASDLNAPSVIMPASR